jgi:hypothetical protein
MLAGGGVPECAGAMAPTPRIPDSLRHRPFSRREALAAGMTARQLDGKYLVKVLPQVYRCRDHVMTDADWILAAGRALPDRAQLSHVSRIQALGLDVGEVWPVHFTIAGDLHLAMDDVFLHRTEVLPPLDDTGVTPAAAFIQLCATATLIEAVAVGDWLLHRRHMTVLEVAELSRVQDWRPGAHQARRVLPLLDAGAMSLRESMVRMRLEFAGLPRPEANVRLEIEGELLGVVDLLLRCVMLVLEYEGRQHAESIGQFNRDITRYAAFRRHGIEYLQITNEMLERPTVMVRRVFTRMRELGHDGPAPVFADRWSSLTAPIPRTTTKGR